MPSTGLPLALNCVPCIGTADLGMVGWDWENMCLDSGGCSQLFLRMVSDGRELWDRLFCRAPRESRDKRIVDSLSSDNNVDIEAPALAALDFLKKQENL